MKRTTDTELDRIITQHLRTLTALQTFGQEALRRAKDWATPLHATGEHGPKNEISDPTGNAGIRFDQPGADRLHEEWLLLSLLLDRFYRDAIEVESKVTWIARDALAENERAGIGYCDCGHYCNGVKDNRLRNGSCDACRKRAERQAAKCPHDKTVWSAGVTTCAACREVLASV